MCYNNAHTANNELKVTKVTENNLQKNNFEDILFPHWDDLPNFDLYMDQVVEYINAVLTPLELPTVTSTMINNYVKKKMIIAPVKKRYQTLQIADILIISLLKPIFSLDQIRAAIDQITANDYPKNAFNSFVDTLLGYFKNPTNIPSEGASIETQLMQSAASVLFHKLEAEKSLALLQQKHPIKEVPTTK